ncbi:MULTISPECIES: hypothetical protein [unclassified Oscillibacter]|jgi:hypothetical protein|uniref:hypothetical protein n=1 Tax=unclassified Oscillibacter TaxID=2629304 RepID=UPI00033BCBFA|nr:MULTISPECIES: hypothetical protein [unclassified Oscillibacter]EOS62610.1 hypothetical protein C816_03958 [Oscillibacter sp. 1-3]MCI9649968.1 hypothetical protein [Oscillibacter sp.]
MEHIVTEDYISSLLSEASSEVQEFRKSCSPGYRTGHESYLRWLEHMGTLGKWVYAQYTDEIYNAFLDYEEPINDYFYAQGLLAAAGTLTGQAVQLAGLECVPGFREKKEALDLICRRFVEQLPQEERTECAGQFAERIERINDSRKFFFLYGFELMFMLLKRAGYKMPDEQLKKLYN